MKIEYWTLVCIIRFDILIYLQPTSPFRKKSQITKSLNELIDNNLNSIWSVSKVEKKFHPKKIITCTKKNYFKLFDKSGEKVVARQQLDNTYIRNGLFYIFKIKKLIEKKSIYLNKSKISITNYHVINIDNHIDLKNAKLACDKSCQSCRAAEMHLQPILGTWARHISHDLVADAFPWLLTGSKWASFL